MLIFKALHILSMFSAVTILVGEALFYARAIGRRDVAALAAVRRVMGGRPVVGVAFLMGGIAFGLLTALTGGFDFFAGWLIAAYLLVVALFLVNGSPWVQRLPKIGLMAIEAEAGQRPVEEVVRAMATSRAGLMAAINVAIVAAIIADMVLKPF